jgi:hypothetical protein
MPAVLESPLLGERSVLPVPSVADREFPSRRAPAIELD